jgi:hypothetical protein
MWRCVEFERCPAETIRGLNGRDNREIVKT